MKKIILFVIAIIAISCSSNSNEPIEETIDYDVLNEEEIQKYIKENNLTTQKTDSGLYYIIHNEGKGVFPNNNSEITVNYKGYFLDKNIFDENDEFTYPLTGLIPGFKEAVQLLKPHGEMTAIMPSRLAYGKHGTISIPQELFLFSI